MKHLVYLFLLAVWCVSCQEEYCYQSRVFFEQDSWHKDSTLTFVAKIPKNEHTYSAYIEIANTTDYANSNIWLFVTGTSPHGKTIGDTLEHTLADRKGRWTGKRNGKVWISEVPFQLKVLETGIYTFTIRQGMRCEELKSVRHAGLMIRQEK